VAILVAAATFATAVVSVRLHLTVAQLRYRLWSLEEDRTRASRELRAAQADLEAARAPRRLMERWRAMRDGDAVPMPRELPALPEPPAEAAPAQAPAETAPERAPEEAAPAEDPLAPVEAGAPAEEVR
jgi:transcription termination factor Rho